MVEAIKDVAGKTAIGIHKTVVTIFCIFGIGWIMYIHVCKDKDLGYVPVVAMVLIAALGGVDIWKNGMLDKLNLTNGSKAL